MLIYHPANDVYHCVFRMLRILRFGGNRTYTVAQIKVLDFLLVFPQAVLLMKLPIEIKVKVRKDLSQYRGVYNSVPNTEKNFRQHNAFQVPALGALAKEGFLDENQFLSGLIVGTSKKVSEIVADRIEKRNQEEKHLMKIVVEDLGNMSFAGGDGLKSRFESLEYNYEII